MVKKAKVSKQDLARQWFWRGVCSTLFTLSLLVITAGGVVATFFPQPLSAQKADDNEEFYDMVSIFSEVFNRVRSDYVEDVSPTDLVEKSINGMLAKLDPYSTYFNAEDFKDFSEQSSGQFGGLGMEVSTDPSGYVKVVAPIDDTPAYRAGVKAGDFITMVNNLSVQGKTIDEVVKMMRGRPGTTVELTIARQGRSEPIVLTLKRERIVVQSVKGELKEGFGYIRITGFTEQTQPGILKIIKKLTADNGGKMPKGFIIDLRNNPGGLLDQAIEVSDDFLDEGEIVSIQGRQKETARRFLARKGDVTNGAPMVVLINGGSASASEIFAGAMKDLDRGVLLGTKTFGKGVVQSVFPLHKPGTAMKLTTQKYYTPSGQSIHMLGVEPDIEVKDEDNANANVNVGDDNRKDIQLEKAIEKIKSMTKKG